MSTIELYNDLGYGEEDNDTKQPDEDVGIDEEKKEDEDPGEPSEGDDLDEDDQLE